MAPTNPGNIRKKLVLMGVLLLLFANPVRAQINFGDYLPEPGEDPEGHYSLILTPLGGYDELNFGMVLPGEGMVDIALDSDEVVIIEIEGVRYLDVFVTLDAPNNLTLEGETTSDANEKMDLVLKGGYANQGAGNYGPSYRQSFYEATTVRFPIFQRPGSPPGPPPTPPHDGYEPPRESAYLFLYGSITVGETQDAGPYKAVINVEVAYDI